MEHFDIFKTPKNYKDRVMVILLAEEISSDEDAFKNFLEEKLDSRTLSVLYQRLSEITDSHIDPKISKITDYSNINLKDKDKYYYVIKNNKLEPVYEIKHGMEKLVSETIKKLDNEIREFKTYKHDSGQAYGNYKVPMKVLCYEIIYLMPFVRLYAGNLTKEEHILKFNTDKFYKEYIAINILSILNGSYYDFQNVLSDVYCRKNNEGKNKLIKFLVLNLLDYLSFEHGDSIIHYNNVINKTLKRPMINQSYFVDKINEIERFKHLVDTHKFDNDNFQELIKFIHEPIFYTIYPYKNKDKEFFNFFSFLSNKI